MHGPEHVYSVDGLREVQFADLEFLQGAPRGDLPPDCSASLDSSGPVLFPGAEEVADNKGPPELLECLVASFFRPICNVNFVSGSGYDFPGTCSIGMFVPYDPAGGFVSSETIVPVN